MEMTRDELAQLVEAHLDDRFHDECGVVGVHGHAEAAKITYLGLYALQHRGQESAGIVSNPGAHRPQAVHRGMGLVADVFNERILEELEGRNAIGHVRYSTAGGSSLVQRAAVLRHHRRRARSRSRTTATSSTSLPIRRELEGRGAIFSTTADSEVIVQLLARSREQLPEERLIDALSRAEGRVQPRDDDRRRADRGARPARLPAALAGPARRRLGGRERDLRARPDRRDATSATSSPARWW